MPLDPKKIGFKTDSVTRTRRPGFVLDIFGPERSGKSDFACSIGQMDPSKPTAYFALDFNYEGPLRRWEREHGLKFMPLEYFYSLPGPPPDGPKDRDFQARANEVADITRPIFRRFKADLWEALRSPKIGGIVIDNGTSLYKLCRFSIFGYIHKVPRHLYARTTAAMSTLVNQVRYSGKNVCWIHRETEIWAKNDRGQDEPTGEFERMGAFKELSYEVMATLHSERLDDGRFRVEVIDSTFNSSIVGSGFRGKKRTFKKVCAALTAEEGE